MTRGGVCSDMLLFVDRGEVLDSDDRGGSGDRDDRGGVPVLVPGESTGPGPPARYFPRCSRHEATNNAIPKCAIQVVHQLTNNELCIRSMATIECIEVKRARLAGIEGRAVPFLLRLLEGGLEVLDNPASTKAQIVKALKAMQRSLLYGEQITVLLDARLSGESTKIRNTTCSSPTRQSLATSQGRLVRVWPGT
ncbi:hypothetical protein ScPMuIL_011723 [Solemya velum]